MNRSAVSVLPPMQAGGWMAEESNVNAVQSQSQRDAPLAFSRKPVLAVSVNGQLLGCLQGFLVARKTDSNQSLSGPLSTGYFEQPAVAYAADILMLPEGLRRGASDGIFPQQLPRQNNFALDSSVEWSKKFSYPLLCSLQQRQVSYMKITVYSADSAKTATSAASKSIKKNIVGTAVLDMSSFVDTDDSPRMFLLPVNGQGQRSGNDLCGWLILGLQYFQSKSNTAAAANVSSNAVDDKAALTWASILSDPTIVTAGYDSLRYTDTAVQKSLTMGMGLGTAYIQPAASPKSESIALHVAMGQLDLSMSVAADLKAAENEILLVLVRAGMPNELLKQPSTAGNRRSNTVRTMTTWDIETAAAPSEDQSCGLAIAVINRATGLPEWDAADITVKCATNKVFTPAVYVSLYRGRRVSGCQIDAASSTFIGEAVVTLSRASLMHGAPINTVAPLRDQDGIRVAILQLGAQKTSLLPPTGASGMGATATAGMRPAPTLLFDRQSMGNNAEDAGNFISLSICIEEGSIIDPFWRQPVEPFFEFTLIPPREDIRMPGSAISRARTGFVSRAAAAATSSSGTSRTRRNNQQAPSDLRLSKNALSASARPAMDSSHSPWGLVCNLLLPRAGFPVGPADEMGKPVWAVAVVCRDAARAGCPEIASARVGLPWSLLARGRSTDQWLVLFNSLAHGAGTGQPGTVSLGMDMAMRSIEAQDSLASSGRIRLRITSKSMGADSGGLQQTTFGRQGPWTGVTALQQFQTQFLGGIDAGPQFALGHTQVRGASHPGIGASLIWLRGLANMRSGQEIEPLNITMASATSLVPPIVSQSVYGEIYHDLADRGDEKERLTFSELVFGRYGNPCKINDDGSRQVCDGWGEDWMAGVPGLDGLCGSLPVAGGHSDLRLGISVAHKKVPYSASFSILSGLTACAPPDSEHDIRDFSSLSCPTPTSVQIPALDILVSAHDDDDSAPSNGTGRKAFAQELRVVVRSVPRLKLWTAFVPFVRGRLTVCCRSVRFPLQAQQVRKSPDGRAHRCALRFAMSTDSFGYTAAFDIPLDTDTVTTMPVIVRSAPVGSDYGQIQAFEPLGTAQKRGRQPKGSATTMKPPLSTSPGRQRDASCAEVDSGFSVTLPIDTLEFTTRGGSCSLLTLQVTLVDLDESGSQYCIGEGGVQTAPLYYQALRAASASAPPTAGPGSFKAAPAAVGLSPWLTSESTLYDRYKQEPAAWVALSTQFVMEGMSLPVVTALQASRHSVEMAYAEEDRPINGRYSAESGNGDSSTCNGSELEELHIVSGSRAVSPYPESTLVNGKAAGSAERRARTELGLKQAFLAADTDRSGSVSVEELLAVIKQSGVKVQKPKPQMGRTGQTRGVVGMEDTFALLLGLAGDTVNMTTVKKNDPLNVTADPSLEQTVRRIFARLDVDGDGMISWWEWQASLSGALLGRHPSEKYIDPVDGLAVIAQAAEDALSARANTSTLSGPESGFPDLWDIPYIDPSGVAKVPMSLWDSGSNTRISQDVSILRSGGGWGTTGLPGDGMHDGTYRDSAVVAAALKRQLEAETAAEEARMAHRNESKKRADLEASLTALKHLNDVVRGAREEKDGAARLLKEKLMADAAGHKDNLDRIMLNKKKRLRASITIALFLKRRVVPRYRRLKLERQRATLGRALLGVFHRRNFLKTMDLRTRATLLLQRKVRGILGRMRLQKLKEAVLKVQRVYRGSRGRDKYQRMLLSRAAGRFSAQFRAAEKLKWALQRFVKRMKAKRLGAAVTIQSAARRRAAFKVLTGKKRDEALRLLRKKAEEEEAARRHDAACLIGKMARDRVAIRDAKGLKTRLLTEREQRDAAAAAKLERESRERALRSKELAARQESEHRAAVAIQAVSRGRMGRTLFSDVKEERDAQQLRLARYQAVARVMRAMKPRPSMRDAAGHWIRFQKKHERDADEVETVANSPVHSPVAANGHAPSSSAAPYSPRGGRSRSVVGPMQPLISPRSKPAGAVVSVPSEGPLLINFRDMSHIPVGTVVEALYGCESEWFAGKIKAIVPVKSKDTNKATQALSSPRSRKVEAVGEESVEDVLYHVKYDDGDEEICSRGKIRVPEAKEKQPGVLAICQELHGKCSAAEMTLRGKVMGGPFKTNNPGSLAEGAGAGTGGGAGPDDEYEVRFYLDDEKEKSVVEKVKRKDIIAPHLSASLVKELKEREVEKNFEKSRQASLAARQVVVKKVIASPRRAVQASSPRKEGLVSVGVSRGEGPDCGLIGEILRVDKHRRIIHAQLLNLSSLNHYTVELPYDHPRLVWFSYDPADGELRDLEEILDLDQIGRPTLEEAASGYYVSYAVPGQTTERCGQVVSVIQDKRAIVTYFQDTLNGLVTDITETISYDNPHLSWYKDESKEGVPALSSWVSQPLLKDATGYLVEVRSLEPDAKPGDMFAGEVIAVDEATMTILVSFDCVGEEEDDEDDVEIIPYNSLDLVWVSPPLSHRSLVPKPPLSQAVGYTVDVFDEALSSKNGPKEVLRGKVMSIRDSDDTMRVRFKNGNADEVFPYESLQVAWISGPPPSFLSRSEVPRPLLPHAVGYGVEVRSRDDDSDGHAYVGEVIAVDKQANSLQVLFEGGEEAGSEPDIEDIKYFSADIAWMKKNDPISSRSLVARPALADAVGYKVDVKSHEPDHDHDDVFFGEVVSVDLDAGTMRVLFEGHEGESGDEDELPYASPDVAWMQRRPVPSAIRSPPGKPSYSRPKGHSVPSSASPPKADSPPKSKPDGKGAADPKASLAPVSSAAQSSEAPQPSSTSSSPLSTVPTPSMMKAVGYTVSSMDLRGQQAIGVVSAVDVPKKSILIRFGERRAMGSRGAIPGSIGTEHFFDFDSPSVAWLKEPEPAGCLLSQSKVPRPPFAQCAGFELGVQSTERDALPDTLQVCIVVSANPLTRTLHVVTQAREGSAAREREVLYDSCDVVWRKFPKSEPGAGPPAAAVESKAVVAQLAERRQEAGSSLPTHDTPGKKRPPLSPQKQRRWDASGSKKPTPLPPLDSAVGFYISVSDADGEIRGKVVGTTRKMLQIKLMDEDEVEDEEVLELQYTSPSIRWYKDWDQGGQS